MKTLQIEKFYLHENKYYTSYLNILFMFEILWNDQEIIDLRVQTFGEICHNTQYYIAKYCKINFKILQNKFERNIILFLIKNH